MSRGLVQESGIAFEAIRRDYPLAEVIGASIRLAAMGNGWKGLCPFHPDRNPSFVIYNTPAGPRWRCFAGCGAGDVIDFMRQLHGVGVAEAARILEGMKPSRRSARPAHPARFDEQVARATAMFDRALPVEGTVGQLYLAGRGIIGPFPPDVRFDLLRYGRSDPMPCLVFGVRDLSGAITGVQRVFLASDGRGKAAVAQPKLSLGRISGGAIRVGDPDESGLLAVCEGPEDGLSLRQLSGWPVWVAAGVGNIARMQFPAGVRKLVIAADNDEPGLVGARKAAQAVAASGIEVAVLRPVAGAKDWNDELLMGVCRGR